MLPDKILYTDAHDVTVTDSTFRVRSHSYQLDRIFQHRISIVKPNRTPGHLFLGLGLIGLTIGVAAESFRMSKFSFQISSLGLSMNIIISLLGILLILSGVIFMIVMKEKYCVHIVTADEERDVLVSNRKEYVMTVEEALNNALINMLKRKKNERNINASPR
jgi:hypothetical protein